MGKETYEAIIAELKIYHSGAHAVGDMEMQLRLERAMIAFQTHPIEEIFSEEFKKKFIEREAAVSIKSVEDNGKKKKTLRLKRKPAQIKIKYFGDVPPLQIAEASDWIDLRSAKDVEMKAGEFKLIPLGVAMQLPEDYEAHIVPRSSTFKNYGLIQTNGIGIVDETYCGPNDEWMFPAYALRDTTVKKGERLCQFRIFRHQPKIKFIPDSLEGNEDRGGFGSTGKR